MGSRTGILFLKKGSLFCISVLCVAILFFIRYPAFSTTSDPYSWLKPKHYSSQNDVRCNSLLRHITPTRHGNDTELFHVSGCKLQTITQAHAIGCMRPGSHVVFIGDSRVRQLFCYFCEFLNKTDYSCWKGKDKRRLELSDILIEFLWQPKADSKMLGLFKSWMDADTRPDIVIIGMGVWRMRETGGAKRGELEYHTHLSISMPYLVKLNRHSRVIWIPQDPVNETILDEKRLMLSNKLISKYNQIARNILEPNGITIWWSSFIMASHFRTFSRDCVHIQPIVDKYKTQILCNWICNGEMKTTVNEKCCGLGRYRSGEYRISAIKQKRDSDSRVGIT